MGDNPDFVNVNFTSFGKKEDYKPPIGAFFGSKQSTKRQRFVPGGEWAQDSTEQEVHQPKVSAQLENKAATEKAPEKAKSNFSFIKKPKQAQTSNNETQNDSSTGLLDFADIRSEN